MYNLSNIEKQKELLKLALEANDGNVSKACLAVGISRQTFYNWRANDSTLFEYDMQQDDEIISLAKAGLKRLILQDNFHAIKLALTCKAGWSDKTTLTLETEFIESNKKPFDYSKLSIEALQELEEALRDDDDINTLGKYPHKISDAVNNTETFLGIDTDFILPNNDRED